MSKPRVLDDKKDAELAAWFANLRRMGTVQQKARELGISVSALYDAIARGDGRLTTGARYKLAHAFDVSRESPHNEAIEDAP